MGILRATFLFVLLVMKVEVSAQDTTKDIKNPKNGNTYVIAHRGAHLNLPENSLAAYKQAIDLGCDFVEIDLRKTKDGQFVSVHNPTVDAYFKVKSGKVNDLLLSELKDTPLGKNSAGGDEYIPTFEEILQLCKDHIGIYLDLKEADIKKQLQIIKDFEMEESIVWYIPAGHKKEIQELQKLCKDCFVMPDPGAEKNLIKVFDEFMPKVVATDMGHLTLDFVNTAHSNGVKVFVDDEKASEKEWRQIIDWGTEGIQTDQPEKLIKYLKSRN